MKAVRYLEAVDPTPQDTKELPYEWKQAFFALKVACLSNHALASMKLEAWDACKTSASRIIDIASTLDAYSKANPETPLLVSDADKGKAHLRCGMAFFKLSEFDSALEELGKAQIYTPNDGMISNLEAQIKKTIQMREQKEKKMYQKMFQ